MMIRLGIAIFTFSYYLQAALSPESIAQSTKLFETARSIIQSGDKSKHDKMMDYLNRAKEILIKEQKLPEELKQQLNAINNTIYWQNKFSALDSLDTKLTDQPEGFKRKKSNKKRVSGPVVKQVSESWLKEKNEREKNYQSMIQSIMDYEKNYADDYEKNLLNFLDVQLIVADNAKGAEVFSKAMYYHEKIVDHKQTILKSVFNSIRDYSSLVQTKDFDKLFMELVKKLKYGNLDEHKRQVVKLYAVELQTIAKLKRRLILEVNSKNSIPIPKALLNGVDGVVYKFSRDGAHIIVNNSLSTIGWGVIHEKAISEMSLHLLDKTKPEDLFALVVSNLNLEEYSTAYKHLNTLISKDEKNVERYKDYLRKCEMGYRIKNGEILEKTLSKVEAYNSKGQTQKAKELMDDLMDSYLNSPLGQRYYERFSFVYGGLVGG